MRPNKRARTTPDGKQRIPHNKSEDGKLLQEEICMKGQGIANKEASRFGEGKKVGKEGKK